MNTEDNLMGFYGMASSHDLAESRWYWVARNECKAAAARCGVDFKRFVYAVAALSPMTRWEVNVKGVEELATTGTTGYGLKANRAKVLKILAGDLAALRGQKVERFAASIINPNKHVSREVVIDTWAIRAAEGRFSGDVKTLTGAEYEELAGAYKRCAARVGLLPGEFQSVIWVVARNLGKRKGQLALDF